MNATRLYQLFRFSLLYNIYLRLFRNSIYDTLLTERRFYKNLCIPKSAIIFDIGANIGDKTALFSKFGAEIIAVEPDIENGKLLRRRFIFNSKIKVLSAAVGPCLSRETFYVNISGSPANTLSKKWKSILENPSANRWSKSLKFATSYQVDVLNLDYLINKYGIPFYVKIDVEGYEVEVIRGLSITVPILSFEANFPEFRTESIECVKLLGHLNSEVSFNCINQEYKYLFQTKLNCETMVEWLENTKLKYFEVFVFKTPTPLLNSMQ